MKAELQAGWRIRRITTGSKLLRRRLGRAFVPLDTEGEIRLLAATIRCGAGAYLGDQLLGLVHQSPALWIAAGSCWWCRAAWKAATGVRPAAAPEETPAVEDAAPADLRQAVVEQLLQWIDDRPGMHLFEVYHRYRSKPGHERLTDEQIRTALVEHYGIPIRRAVRDTSADQPVRVGIYRDDLQPLPSPDETVPVAEPATGDVTSAVAV